MKIYALGGLGADKRTFNYIQLNKHELVCLDWIDPKEDDTLETYAARLSEQIRTNEPFGVLGVSFGGMVMTEVAKILHPNELILVSSVATRKELPSLYKATARIQLDRILPYGTLVRSGRLIHYLFGVKMMRDKKLLGQIMEDMDPKFISWAIKVILRWQNDHVPQEPLRIHGLKDRVLPVKPEEVNYPVEGAGHFIIVNEAEYISSVLDKIEV